MSKKQDFTDDFDITSNPQIKSKGKFRLSAVSDLLLAKRHLYSLLLQKDGGGSESNLTDGEIELMYQLSIDHEIQEYLSNNR